MAIGPQNRAQQRPYAHTIEQVAIDAGLRAFMLGVYNKVALGLLLSAALAFLTSSFQPISSLLYTVSNGRVGYTVWGMVIAFAPLAVMMFGMFGMRNATPKTAGIFYWTIVSLIGASLGVVVLRYTGESIASTFLLTATAFGALSLFGYTTKKDMTAFGSFLIMGMWGLFGASLINLFLGSSMMSLIINALGVFIFAGLIAFDTQRLKMQYYELGGDQAAMGVATNFGALSLYLNFINLFQFLLAFLGDRR